LAAITAYILHLLSQSQNTLVRSRNDQECALIAPHVAQKDGSGKKRTVNIREVLNAIFYRTTTGCQWRMLPSDFPAWDHVWYYYRIWRNDGTLERINTLLRREVRIEADRDPEPGVGIIDSQSVEATEIVQWCLRPPGPLCDSPCSGRI
jgi:putative transposase